MGQSLSLLSSLRRLSTITTTTAHRLSLSKPLSSQTTQDPNPSSLSSRMSFVFDQIDSQNNQQLKDQTLTRIRNWRLSKKTPPPPPVQQHNPTTESPLSSMGGLMGKEVEMVHPWPEWIEFLQRLVTQNYFDHIRRDEDALLHSAGFSVDDVAEAADEVFDFTRDWKTVQTASLNFAKDRFDIFRSLSRHDIQILVGHGCPSADKKVVFSSKLLRKHVHLDEGDVCSSCKLRNSCERAYLTTNKEDEARTIDIIRVLLTYGFDPINKSVINESLMKIKSVKTTVRKLLHEVVKLSAVPIDPNLPPPVIKKPPPKVKIPPPPPRRRVGRDDIEMKMGDWICQKCDFMNFAKNTICLQCDARRPKRQLLPGEWECPECNFLNYRRNTVCFHCEHKRPPDEFTENQFQDRQRGPRSRPEKVPNRDGVCNAWNFDFDDNESDGADVAAFEYADSHKMDEDFGLNNQVQGENFKGPIADPRPQRFEEKNYSDHRYKKSSTGFDDFDDEEDDDDIDSYELDTPDKSESYKRTKVDFSEVEDHSESEDVEEFDQGRFSRPNNFRPHDKPARGNRRRSSISGDDQDFDSDEDLPVCSNKSPTSDSRQRSRAEKARKYDSDDDYGLDSDTDDFVGSGCRENKTASRTQGFKRTPIQDSDDESFSGLDSDDGVASSRDRYKRGTSGPSRRGDFSKGHGQFSGGSRMKSNGRNIGNDSSRDGFKRGNSGPSRRGDSSKGRDSFSAGSRMRSNGRDAFDDDFSRPRGSRDNSRLNEGSEYVNQRRGGSNEKGGFRMNERSGFGKQRRGGSNEFSRNTDMSNEEKERYMRPRVNVR